MPALQQHCPGRWCGVLSALHFRQEQGAPLLDQECAAVVHSRSLCRPGAQQRELIIGRAVNLVIDSREGIGFGQTVADWRDTLGHEKNVFWIENGDVQGFLDLLSQRLARLK